MKPAIVSLRSVVLFWVLHSCQLLASKADDSSPPLRIEVRASVDDLWQGMKKRDPVPHGKNYYIMSLSGTASDVPLIRPVDEGVLRKKIEEEL
ncbi:MAG: hypothetical protein ABIV50_07780, partial [Opitutus sp.]